MRRVIVLPLLLAVIATPTPAAAWGFEAHKFIMARAIALLPAEIRPFFSRFEASIVEHSIDPDFWRTVGWLDESTRHFVDMDAYGPYPFKDLPRQHAEAVKRYGAEFVTKNGTLPWRTEEMYQKPSRRSREVHLLPREHQAVLVGDRPLHRGRARAVPRDAQP